MTNTEQLLREALIALEHHVAQTRPIELTSNVIFAIREHLTQPAQAGEAVEFFAFHGDMGVQFCRSQEEAQEFCRENLKAERAQANDTGEWDDDLAESIRWGVVLGRAKFFENPGQEGEDSGDYKMVGYAAPPASQELLLKLAAIAAECSDPDTTDALDQLIAATPVSQEQAKWTDADSDAARLALELECLLLDTKDTAAASRWWSSALEALELHRARINASQEQAQQPSTAPGVPEGWKLRVTDLDGRKCLVVESPEGQAAALSTASSIAGRILDALAAAQAKGDAP